MKKNGLKNIWTVLGFEIHNYTGSKSFVISTIVICILALGIMFAPRFIDGFAGTPSNSVSSDKKNNEDEETIHYGIYDPDSLVNKDTFNMYFNNGELKEYDTVDELTQAINDEKIDYGFGFISLTDVDYYVLNKEMDDSGESLVSEMMLYLNKVKFCEDKGIDINEYMSVENTSININSKILGKDSAKNYWYCYALVIIVFMMIIMFGVMIATSVTTEKSNRSIELLVTSTPTYSILFGKVFAGAIAAVVQVGVVFFSIIGGYQMNKEYWGGKLDMVLDIPGDVLITYAIFGLGGFLFYAFLYGAMGALVSKTEDLNKTTGSVQMIIMIVYFVVLINLTNVDGILIKVCSYLPISSYSAMFARVAMGKVNLFEIIISALVLYISVILMGFIAGKIYRNSTLRYGNPIKISTAFKNALKK